MPKNVKFDVVVLRERRCCSVGRETSQLSRGGSGHVTCSITVVQSTPNYAVTNNAANQHR